MELSRSAGILLHPTSLSFQIHVISGWSDWVASLQIITKNLQAIGIDANVKLEPDWNSWYPNASSTKTPTLLWQVAAAGSPYGFFYANMHQNAFIPSGQDGTPTGNWAHFGGGEALADQVRFEREWTALRGYAAERGVSLIGDLPIYVSDEGADLAGWPELFADGEVAGAPPDALSASGQRWGNPLYDWPVHRVTGFRWWRERFRRTFELVDLCRVDHFRGYVSYWAIPERNATAKRGHWRPGLGAALFDAVERELGDLPLIAEDLGHITQPVLRLRDELGLPGIVVLLWAFRRARGNPHALENHRRNSVAYTSTHDTDTAAGWFAGLGPRQQAATGLDPREPSWGLMELAYSSRAALAIVSAQDVLGLGSEARMNRPGRPGGNWRWRLEQGALTPALARRLRALAEQHDRARR